MSQRGKRVDYVERTVDIVNAKNANVLKPRANCERKRLNVFLPKVFLPSVWRRIRFSREIHSDNIGAHEFKDIS